MAVIWNLVVLFGVLARLGPGLGLVFLRDLVSLKKERLENRVDLRNGMKGRRFEFKLAISEFPVRVLSHRALFETLSRETKLHSFLSFVPSTRR